MKRVIFTIAVLIASGFGSLANEPTKRLLALPEQEKHEVLFGYVQQGGGDCDEVVRSMLRHNVTGETAFWNVGCRNGKSYWVIISPNTGPRPLVLNCTDTKLHGYNIASWARQADQPRAKSVACWKKF